MTKKDQKYLNSMRKPELKLICEFWNLSNEGTKKELIKRLIEFWLKY